MKRYIELAKMSKMIVQKLFIDLKEFINKIVDELK